MALTPTGNPAWARTADFTSYGGHVNKRNHLSQGVIDPETDLGAEEFMRLAADLAAIARVSPWCVINLTCNDTVPAAPTVHSVLQMTGVNVAGYEGAAPPSGMPTLSNGGTGSAIITWGTSYADPYGVIAPLALKMAKGCVNLGTTGQVVTQVLSDYSVRVRAFDETGAAITDAPMTIEVW